MHRVRPILEATLRITASPSLVEACDAALETAFATLGVARSCVVVRERASSFRCVAQRGLPGTAIADALAQFRPDAVEPTVLGGADLAADAPLPRTLRAARVDTCTVLPVRADDRLLGWLLLGGELDAESLASAALLAALLGATASRIATLEEARRETNLRGFLSEVEGIIAASLDVGSTMAAVARLVVPRLADWCAVELLDDHGGREDIVVHHSNPELVELGREVKRMSRGRVDSLTARVLRLGEPVLIHEVTPKLFATASPAQQDLLARIGMGSLLLVPLRARGRSIGLLFLAHAESGRRFVAEDLATATRLADRTAIAVDNARLYQAARQTSERLELALEAGRMGNWEFDVATGRVWWSAALEAIHGLRPGTFGGTWEHYLADIHPDDRDAVIASVQASLSAESHRAEYRIVLPDGTVRWVEGRGRVVRDHEGRAVRLTGVCLDVTDRKCAEQVAEEERAKVSKLESVGVLAGGIAHDFNNLLTAVIGNLTLARAVVEPSAREHRWVVDAERAALRARGLTRQLLTFAKGGAPVRQRASLGELVRESASFVLSGSNVRPFFEIDAGLWPADVDAGQISQVVQNIVLNAQQAMPDGGCVFVRVRNAELDGHHRGLPPGPYVRLEVEDQGAGIAPEHLGRIFDPFFTTRAKGTGLGLATSYSIVRKHDGHIGVESAPGQGARFVVHLPARPGAAGPDARDPAVASRPRFGGLALVMDDEELTLETARNLLSSLGFDVVPARDGDAAVTAARIAVSAGRPFDVIILDLTVPGGKGGRAAVTEILAFQPDARVIVSSGYSDDPVMADCGAYGFRDVVAKPYTLTEIAKVLERLLAAPALEQPLGAAK